VATATAPKAATAAKKTPAKKATKKASRTTIALRHKSHLVLHRSTYGNWSPEFIKIAQLAIKEENIKRNNRGKTNYLLKKVVDASKSKTGNAFVLTLLLQLSGKLSTYLVKTRKDGIGGVTVSTFEDSDQNWLNGYDKYGDKHYNFKVIFSQWSHTSRALS
jgi:hypothetical protein